ncbi:twin-arginine translocation protein, TatB subunit [Thermodesulfobacterium geofontis OPF15]|jgi:sec-independent protein translocase protein TatB|uniref:Twin-arginine translocation protein, TatB subunit n=1 Tax=Thermodesulfobacterium geofontis (strain OPF15) TaxID=795359 RepID=F8C3W6_THEGP|nr:Sec-independent protein translocase protein TatB [Thermodesulfobacterium geofontis]AEH23693.1 twin-arginine translocation protein, TatB subunit [Thermodesulfobacterium geofontis OPF15]
MFNIGFSEAVIIFLVALIVLGPEKLPEIGKFLGKLSLELKKGIEDIKRELEIEEVEKEFKEEIKEVKKEIEEIKEASTQIIENPLKSDEKDNLS